MCVYMHVYMQTQTFIQYRFRREKRPGTLTDIYDGSAYTKHSQFFEHKY